MRGIYTAEPPHNISTSRIISIAILFCAITNLKDPESALSTTVLRATVSECSFQRLEFVVDRVLGRARLPLFKQRGMATVIVPLPSMVHLDSISTIVTLLGCVPVMDIDWTLYT